MLRIATRHARVQPPGRAFAVGAYSVCGVIEETFGIGAQAKAIDHAVDGVFSAIGREAGENQRMNPLKRSCGKASQS